MENDNIDIDMELEIILLSNESKKVILANAQALLLEQEAALYVHKITA